MARPISGMNIAITGASAGIGRALAVALHARGARLTLAARRMPALDALNTQLGGGHQVVPCDVSREADCRTLVESAVARHGRIDVMVCNAGFGLLQTAEATTRAEWEQILATNLLGTADCARFAVAAMRNQSPVHASRGHIIIVASALSRRGMPGMAAYSATKAAQANFAEALRVELAPAGIAVTTVHPVGAATEFFAQVEARSGATLPPRRPGEMTQSVATVVNAITRAIQRPRPEVWPVRRAKWATLVAAALPRLADFMMRRVGSKLR